MKLTHKHQNLWIAAAVTVALGIAAERFDHKVRNDFFAGFTGNQAALERGMKACEEILADNPKHPEALVWHGAGLFFFSGQAFQKGDFAKGQDLWVRGLKEMDDAVALAPDSIGVRAPRGASLLQASLGVPPDRAPELLKRGVEDYEKMFEIQKDSLAKMGEHPRGELLFGLAQGWYRYGNQEKARQYFERVVKEVPGSEYEKRAKIWLETGKLARNQMTCVGCHVQ